MPLVYFNELEVTEPELDIQRFREVAGKGCFRLFGEGELKFRKLIDWDKLIIIVSYFDKVNLRIDCINIDLWVQDPNPQLNPSPYLNLRQLHLRVDNYHIFERQVFLVQLINSVRGSLAMLDLEFISSVGDQVDQCVLQGF